ncbi:MAG: hypothetical protein KIT84_22250 [Labilithrix sp.]|nr:hypothetical protein [Labilithrix sp.]MCW5813767.1 hypothetical protein [Labilithrix sp.]
MFKPLLFSALAAFAVACSVESADDAAAGAEAEVNSAATYTLTKDFDETLSGTAKSGSPIEIRYALERLPQCRGNQGGRPGWNIAGFYSLNGAPAKSFEVTKLTADGADREAAAASITPLEGGDLAIWFQVTSVFGCSEYDSDLGANYHIAVEGPAPDALPTISFGKDGAPTVRGELKVGKAKVHYEQERLRSCEAYRNGYPVYGIGGYASINGGPAKSFETGRAEAGKRVAVDTVIELPAAGDLALWFDTSSVHGCHAYDSALGANYHFTIAR